MRAGIRRAVGVWGAGTVLSPYLIYLGSTSFDAAATEMVWLFGFAAAFVPSFIDNWLRLPRRTPQVTPGHIAFAGPRTAGFVGGAIGVGMYGLARVTEVEPDDGPFVAFIHPLMPYISSILVLGGIVAFIRPYRLKVGPQHLRISRLVPKPRLIAWSDISAFEPRIQVTPQRMVVPMLVVMSNGTETTIPAQDLQPTLWVFAAWLNHYLDHPEDRYELATQAGIDRLDAIEAAHRANPDRPWPRWFPPPLPE